MNLSQTDFSSPLERLPVLGICGYSGAGKTTLIESLVPAFVRQGLKVAVVKYDAHKVSFEQSGKDSDRFFQVGGDVWLSGRDSFFRYHDRVDPRSMFISLGQRYDLVLVEGHVKTPVPKIWLLDPGQDEAPGDLENKLAVFSRQESRDGDIFIWINQWLSSQWLKTPVWGCLLIGGRSSRMGTPKHLLMDNGRTWIEQVVGKMEKKVDRIVISGKGEVPETLSHIERIPDILEVDGPLSGVLAVMRWAPLVSWLVSACDLPLLQTQALDWLLARRAPGIWAVQPDLAGDGQVEPLLAYYDFRAKTLLEEFAVNSRYKLSELAQSKRVENPRPPGGLHQSWKNLNTPADLHHLKGEK